MQDCDTCMSWLKSNDRYLQLIDKGDKYDNERAFKCCAESFRDDNQKEKCWEIKPAFRKTQNPV